MNNNRYIPIKVISTKGKLYLPWEIKFHEEIDDDWCERYTIKDSHEYLPDNWIDGVYDLKNHKVVDPLVIVNIPSKTESEFKENDEILIEVDGKYGYYALDKIKSKEQIIDQIEIVDLNQFNKYYRYLAKDEIITEGLIEIHHHKWIYHLESGKTVHENYQLKRLLK